MLVKYPVNFVAATRDEAKTEPDFEVTIDVDSDQKLEKAFETVIKKLHPEDSEKHKYTFLLQSPNFLPIVINGKSKPSDFPNFSRDWKIIVISAKAKSA
ncbi:uncharacterized protein I206_104648 [Kwoniella pini CBS 10737]|uniref:Ubiquitin-like protein ATG12 n=1 Tax=Kwoniella pini CBS 10737 TaxID=1296096 RepID=A0A1B9I7P3_9TREE|nr:uncharacterized protein I206_02185 [Kwoniella pini CBS 10737]OCF51471.1 hypothetical protein I206_02185 [Kwoniella pini CBS 10737]